jgi:hypothetical protein
MGRTIPPISTEVTYNQIDEPLVFSKALFDILLKEDNPGELLALYAFYYYTAKWQRTNQPMAIGNYTATALKIGIKKVKELKHRLRELGLIESIVRRDSQNRVSGHFIGLNMVWQTPAVQTEGPEGPFRSRGSVFHRVQNGPSNALNSDNKKDIKTRARDRVTYGELKDLFPKEWLDNDGFIQSFNKYVTHRRQQRKDQFTKMGAEQKVKEWTQYPIQTIIQAIDEKISHDWVDIYPDKIRPQQIESHRTILSHSIPPEEVISRHFKLLKSSWLDQVLRPALAMLPSNTNGEGLQVATGICRIADWFDSQQKRPTDPRGFDGPKLTSQEEAFYSKWTNIPGAFHIIREYIEWLKGQTWLSRITPSAFQPESKIFEQYFNHAQRNRYGINLFTGQPLH